MIKVTFKTSIKCGIENLPCETKFMLFHRINELQTIIRGYVNDFEYVLLIKDENIESIEYIKTTDL